MARHKRTQDATAVGEAFTRAAGAAVAELPARFTVEQSPDSRYNLVITDTSTGRRAEVQTAYFGMFRRVLSELFPDD